MPELVFRRVLPTETKQVVALHREAFPRDQWLRSIFASVGVHHYLANLITFPEWQTEHIIVGAWEGCNLIAYAHCRAVSECWHLNQVAVHSQRRGKGIGGKLLDLWCEEGAQRGYKELSLDVYQSNESGVQWYTRRGFITEARTWIYEEPLAPSSDTIAGGVRLSEWENAQAWHSVYGFSKFALTDSFGRTWRIGRLGDLYYRMTGYPSSSIKGCLSSLDSERRLLVLSPNPLGEAGKQVDVIHRMRRYLGDA